MKWRQRIQETFGGFQLAALRTTLVAMPWQQVTRPSIQIATLAATATAAGFHVEQKSLFLDFLNFMIAETRGDESPFTVDSYTSIGETTWLNGSGDWVFNVPPFRDLTPEEVQGYLDYLRPGASPTQLDALQRLKELAPAFLQKAKDEILSDQPDAVGFTTTFSQNVASLVLAKMLKAERPEIKIVFGGANCDGPMGKSLHRSFPWIDYVVQGEAEYAFPGLLRCLEAGLEPADVPGAIYRRDGRSVANGADSSAAVRMDDVPMPIYDEYFGRLSKTSLRHLRNNVSIPVESSRGCWWGDKHQCTFCGLNGSTIAFRSKSPDKFQREIERLARRYRMVRFQAVDNILDLRYFKTLLPALKQARAAGEDFTFFYEVKANMKKEHLQMLADAGVETIQPGIESLSTNVLRLMDKGVTALQNLRLLKWAKEYNIYVAWTLLWGFVGETADDYRKILDLIPSITHLPPAGTARLLLERFSPYFEKAGQYGIEIHGPVPHYKHIYPIVGQDLYDLAYDFAYSIPKAVDEVEKLAIIGQIQKAIEELWAVPGPQRATRGILSYYRGPGFITIVDRRPTLPPQDYTFAGVAAELYLACDAGVSVAQLTSKFSDRAYPETQIKEVLDMFVQKRLMFEEDGQYLSLATAIRPSLEYDVRTSQLAILEPEVVPA